jgi:hypothetical protein
MLKIRQVKSNSKLILRHKVINLLNSNKTVPVPHNNKIIRQKKMMMKRKYLVLITQLSTQICRLAEKLKNYLNTFSVLNLRRLNWLPR